MTVVEHVEARITSIAQLFPALQVASVRSLQLLDSATATDPSEFVSALASVATGDALGSTGGRAAAAVRSAGAVGAVGAVGVAGVAGVATPGGATGADVVADARQYLGVPYRYGGTDPATGLDCSALVQRAYADLGISLPRTSQQQAKVGIAVPSLAQAQPGDLVCFGSPATHVGIYAGDGTMIVAPHTGTTVQVQHIGRTPSTIRRIVGSPAEAAAAMPPGAAARPAALALANPYAARFSSAEAQYHLPAGLLSGVAKVESNFNPNAVSSAGAIGLMQMMPATAKALGIDPADPAQAIDGAARLLAGELAKYGSVPLALAAYNAGGPAVDRFGGIPPYPQTRAYVQKVMSYLRQAA